MSFSAAFRINVALKEARNVRAAWLSALTCVFAFQLDGFYTGATTSASTSKLRNRLLQFSLKGKYLYFIATWESFFVYNTYFYIYVCVNFKIIIYLLKIYKRHLKRFQKIFPLNLSRYNCNNWHSGLLLYKSRPIYRAASCTGILIYCERANPRYCYGCTGVPFTPYKFRIIAKSIFSSLREKGSGQTDRVKVQDRARRISLLKRNGSA